MIKMRFRDGLILLGLSDGNLRRLRAGEPIMFDGADLGLEGCRFGIFWGADEQSMMKQLEQSGIGVKLDELSYEPPPD